MPSLKYCEESFYSLPNKWIIYRIDSIEYWPKGKMEEIFYGVYFCKYFQNLRWKLWKVLRFVSRFNFRRR